MATLHTSRSNSKMKVIRRVRASNRSPTSTIVSDANQLIVPDENHENVVFIWFDPQGQSNLNLVGPFRAINDSVLAYTDSSACFNTIKSSKEKIFFICSKHNSELISTVHGFSAVEAIFILDSNGDNLRGDWPKVFGIFAQQEELFRVLKDVFEAFEQIQLEEFIFEEEKLFFWSQLWKEELNRKMSTNKQAFYDLTRHYYRDNTRVIEIIAEFEKSYRPNEAIHWCCRSPFPARFLLHALRSHSKTQLNASRFLFADVSRFFQQQPKRKTGDQIYRGMKLSSELLDQFEARIGQVVCTSGFFPCTKSRTQALASASLPTYRPDLLPVFFKIDCDASSLYTEISYKNTPPQIVFDICTTFRIVYVNRGSMSIVKMKTANEAGKKIALDYLEKNKDQTVQSLLDELLRPPKPPTPPRIPTPPPPPPPPPPEPERPLLVETDVPIISSITIEEKKAQAYLEKGDIDLALVAYRRIQPVTARVLNAIGQLCSERKGDYEYALQCHKQALRMQEKSSEDTSETLTYLGNIHHTRSEYELALHYHRQALDIRQAVPSTEPIAISASLIGLANAHWALHQHSEAVANAEQALAIRETLNPSNETSVAETLALLGNIYHDFGDTKHALDLGTKALLIFERHVPETSPILAELLYNLGTMHSSTGDLSNAQKNFERSVRIYRKILPRGHQDRFAAENALRQTMQIREKNKQNNNSQQ